MQTVQQTDQTKPEADINNELYKLKTGRTISTFGQQDLLDQRDRLVRKKKLTKREDRDLQAIQAAILRREAAMATGAAVGVGTENRLQQVVNERKQIAEDNKRNAEILKQAQRDEAKRRKAEEKLEAERIKQAEAQTKILENQAAATAAATTEGGTQDAIQEQETNEVVVQEQARDSEAVPEGDQQTTTVEVWSSFG